MVSSRKSGRSNRPEESDGGILREFDDVTERSMDGAQKSNRFMRQLLIAGITRLLIERKIMPVERTESVRIRDGFFVNVFNPTSSASGRELSSILKGAFEALDNGWLQSLDVGVVPSGGSMSSEVTTTTSSSKTHVASEVYRFEFEYRNNRASSVSFGGFLSSNVDFLRGKKAVREFGSLFKTICRSIDKLAKVERSSSSAKIRVKANLNRDAPVDFMPHGFENSSCGNFVCSNQQQQFKQLGIHRTQTRFHRCELKILADKSMIRRSDHRLSTSVRFSKGDIENEPANASIRLLRSNCPCQVIKDNHEPFLVCKQCRCYRHACCFASLKSGRTIQTNSCHECSPQDPSFCLTTDERLQKLNNHSKQSICLWRRVLFLWMKTGSLALDPLARFLQSKRRATSYLEMLEKMDIVTSDGTGDEIEFRFDVDKMMGMCKMYGLLKR